MAADGLGHLALISANSGASVKAGCLINQKSISLFVSS